MNHLTLLAYHHAAGWTDWLAHVTISAIVHALIYSTVFRLMHHLTLGQAAVLVVVVLGCLFMWARALHVEASLRVRTQHANLFPSTSAIPLWTPQISLPVWRHSLV